MTVRKKSLHISKRRTVLRATLVCPLAGWITSSRALPVRLPTFVINGNRQTFSAPQVSVPPGVPTPRAQVVLSPYGELNFGKFSLSNGARILKAAEDGSWAGVILEFYNAVALPTTPISLFVEQLKVWNLFGHWLATGGYVNQPFADAHRFAYGHTQGMTPLMGLFNTWLASNPLLPPIQDWKAYGSPLMPLAAFSHWLSGNGAPVMMDMKSLDVIFYPGDSIELMKIINDPAKGPGSYPVSARFSINLFDNARQNLWSAFVLGRVSGQITGTLDITSDGGYRLRGNYTFNPDLFNADRSSRPFVQEKATDLLRMIGTMGVTDYTIMFQGSKSVDFSGIRDLRR